MEAVRHRGDAAVREYTAKFDRVTLDEVCMPIEVHSSVRSWSPPSKSLFIVPVSWQFLTRCLVQPRSLHDTFEARLNYNRVADISAQPCDCGHRVVNIHVTRDDKATGCWHPDPVLTKCGLALS